MTSNTKQQKTAKQKAPQFILTKQKLNPLYSRAKSGELRVEKWFVDELYDLAREAEDNIAPDKEKKKRLKEICKILDEIIMNDCDDAQKLIDKAEDEWFQRLSLQEQRESNRHSVVNNRPYERTLNFTPADIDNIHAKAKDGTLKVESWFMRRLYSLSNYHQEYSDRKKRQEQEVNAILSAAKSGDMELTQKLINETADIWYDRFDDGHKTVCDRTIFEGDDKQ